MSSVAPARRAGPPAFLAEIHPRHPVWGRVLLILDRLWGIIWWLWTSVVLGGFLVGLLVTYLTTPNGASISSDPRQWKIIHPLLTHPVASSVGLGAALVLTALSYTAHRMRATLSESPQARSTYALERVDRIRPGAQLKLARYLPGVYLTRPTDEQARGVLAKRRDAPRQAAGQPLGALIVGRPTQGKTRLAWEAVRATLPTWTFVHWVHNDRALIPFDVEQIRGQRIVLWLDDAQEYTTPADASLLNDLPRRLANVGAQVAIVATCRDGDDEQAARAALGQLFDQLVTITPADISNDEADHLSAQFAQAEGESQAEQRETRAEFDGTPGSLRVGVKRMRDERYPRLNEDAKRILRAIKLLRSAQIYTYTESRVRAVAEARFGLPPQDAAWFAARQAACESDFLRLGSPDENGKRLLEPVADVYLERAIPDYPTPGAEAADDWPALLTLFLGDPATHAHTDAPPLDADALNSLGNAFNEHPRGDLRRNRQNSEACFRAALTVATREAAPSDWATTQNNLGNALGAQANLAEGDEQQRLFIEAVAAYRAALTVRTRDTAPSDWAATQNNLGNALGDQATLAEGDAQARLLGEAISAYRAALTIYTRDATPSAWAMTQNNLGAALWNQAALAAGAERARLLGEAISAYRAALTVSTRDTAPNYWAGAQNNLGATLRDQAALAAGAEQARLLGEAISAYRAALTIYTRDAAPSAWALTQNNLGLALGAQANLAEGAEQARLLGEAISAYRAALTVRTRDAAPSDWAATQNNLGAALQNQANFAEGAEQARLLGEAIIACRAALTVRTRDAAPSAWAATQNNLGNALMQQAALAAGAEQARLLGEAISAYRAALTIYTREDSPYYHGLVTENLERALQMQ